MYPQEARLCLIDLQSSDENKRLLAIYLKVVPTQNPNTSMTQYKLNLIQFNRYLITHKFMKIRKKKTKT